MALSSELRECSRATIADYAAVAEGYARGNASHDVSQNVEAFLSNLKSRGEALDVLDLCCAGGRDLITFVGRGHRAVGVDGVAEFCEMSRKASGCEVMQQDLQDLSLGTEAFDGIYANACLFHCPSASLPEMLRRIVQALRPGGVLFVSNAHGFGEDREGWTDGRTPTTRSYVCWLSEETWKKHCQDASLELLDLYYRPPGRPRSQQPFLATVWRKPAQVAGVL